MRGFWLLFLVLSTSFAQAADTNGCRGFWKKMGGGVRAVYRYQTTPDAGRPFDQATFEKAKEYFTRKLKTGEKITEDEVEKLGKSRSAISLALLEAAADHGGTTHSDWRYSISTSRKWREREQKALAELDLKDELDWADMEDFLQRFYFASHDPAKNYRHLPGWLSANLPTPRKEDIRQFTQEQIWHKDLMGAVDALGILRDPHLRSRFRNFLALHPNLKEGIYVAGFDTFAWYALGKPLVLPAFYLGRAVRLTPDQLQRAATQGFDALYPELKATFGRLAEFDAAYEAGRFAVYRAAIGVITYGIVASLVDHPFMTDPRYWKFLHRFHHVTDQEAADLQKKTFKAEKIRREQFLSFKQEFEDENGPFAEALPNPWDDDYLERCQHFLPRYQEEADEFWRVLQAMTPDQLEATFPEAQISR